MEQHAGGASEANAERWLLPESAAANAGMIRRQAGADGTRAGTSPAPHRPSERAAGTTGWVRFAVQSPARD
jgi:hypothetical protein